MLNPFEDIVKRLERIEALLLTNKCEHIPTLPVVEKPISQKELSAFLGTTPQTIIRWQKKKKIPFMRIGSTPRYNLTEVLKALGK